MAFGRRIIEFLLASVKIALQSFLSSPVFFSVCSVVKKFLNHRVRHFGGWLPEPSLQREEGMLTLTSEKPQGG